MQDREEEVVYLQMEVVEGGEEVEEVQGPPVEVGARHHPL